MKQKRAKWEPTRNSSICSKHFTEEDYIRRFTFLDELTNKPIVPRLKRDEIGVTAVPSVHAEAVTKTPVISESAKRRLERAVRLENLCFEIVSNFFIYLYGEHSKAFDTIKNSSFISIDAQECEKEDAEFDVHGNP